MPDPIIIGNATLINGDCLAVMPTLAADSLDAIVTDPPYGLSFMGKDWDHGIPGTAFWVEALRVAKPGAHLLAFGGSRTFHRLVCAIEDAGWEVRDVLMWVYGSGFPKSLDVSKALDKREGAEREVIGVSSITGRRLSSFAEERNDSASGFYGEAKVNHATAPATDAARQWAGWGTALKPAYEPILLARKPLAGTVAANVLAHGCGVLNIDGCRVATDGKRPHIVNDRRNGNKVYQNGLQGSRQIEPTTLGRFPANFIHDGSPEVVALFPDGGANSTGENGVAAKAYACENQIYGFGISKNSRPFDYQDGKGSAARFFYCAKASRSDRNSGLDSCVYVTIEWSQATKENHSWESEARKATLLVDMEQSPPRVIGVSGTPLNNAIEWNTMLSGSDRTDKYHKGLTFTTKTGTRSTIASIILSFFQSYLTNASTQAAKCETESCGSRAESADTGTLSIVTTNEKMALALGADNALSTMQLKISARGAQSGHPTVKPTALMQYLCRLITPPGGTVLDPFAGSGSTGKAALLEGFRFVGIEQEPEYLAIAAARVRAAHEQQKQIELLADLPAPAPFIPRQAPSAHQVQLFEAA